MVYVEGHQHARIRGGKSKILFIDDEEHIRKSVGTYLERAGYDVDYAVDGEDGLLKYNPGMYAVVVCDKTMPKMLGDEVVQRIKKMSPKQPVVFLSSEVEWFTEEDRQRIGADRYINKPASTNDILAAVRELEKNKV